MELFCYERGAQASRLCSLEGRQGLMFKGGDAGNRVSMGRLALWWVEDLSAVPRGSGVAARASFPASLTSVALRSDGGQEATKGRLPPQSKRGWKGWRG